MIIPIRCFTCGKVIADVWLHYQERCKQMEEQEGGGEDHDENFKNIEKKWRIKVFEELQINKMCCKRHLLSHVDLIEIL